MKHCLLTEPLQSGISCWAVGCWFQGGFTPRASRHHLGLTLCLASHACQVFVHTYPNTVANGLSCDVRTKCCSRLWERPFESCSVLLKATKPSEKRFDASVNFKCVQYWIFSWHTPGVVWAQYRLFSWHTPGVVWVLLFSVALVLVSTVRVGDKQACCI